MEKQERLANPDAPETSSRPTTAEEEEAKKRKRKKKVFPSVFIMFAPIRVGMMITELPKYRMKMMRN